MFLMVVWMMQEAEEGRGDNIEDWTGKTLAGGVRDNSKSQEELQRTGASFRGIRPSAMKMEHDDER